MYLSAGPGRGVPLWEAVGLLGGESVVEEAQHLGRAGGLIVPPTSSSLCFLCAEDSSGWALSLQILLCSSVASSVPDSTLFRLQLHSEATNTWPVKPLSSATNALQFSSALTSILKPSLVCRTGSASIDTPASFIPSQLHLHQLSNAWPTAAKELPRNIY